MKYGELLSFIAENPRSSRKLKSLQIIIRQLLFDQHRCNEIYNRRNHILYRESYFKQNHQKQPKETCSNCLYRLFVTHDPYPFRYDYEVIPTIEKSKINVLTSYFKVNYYLNGYTLDIRPIKSVKETGEVISDSVGISVSSHTNGICGPGSVQVANNPHTSRSRVASRSRTNSYLNYVDNDDNDDDDDNDGEDNNGNNQSLDKDLFISQNNNYNNNNIGGSRSSNNTTQAYPLLVQNSNNLNINSKKISINSKSILTNYSSNLTIQNPNCNGGSANDRLVLSPSNIKPSLLLHTSPRFNCVNTSEYPTGTTTILRNRVVKISTNYISPKGNCRDLSFENRITPPPENLPNFIPEDEEEKSK